MSTRFCPSPITKTMPFASGSVPSPSWSPRTRSRMFARAAPVFRRTADENSLTAQVSPEAMS